MQLFGRAETETAATNGKVRPREPAVELLAEKLDRISGPRRKCRDEVVDEGV
jgi:hypothetical protein